ncbi:hypothetical protein [Cohnella sp. AR92]|uniref:hypothetical protein n=1 Tax=Cohnella sp. AR92 TaxID=648716 RepID=UPI001EDF3ABC|nr:hypothetical protein [Cohnella sp. AR92]
MKSLLGAGYHADPLGTRENLRDRQVLRDRFAQRRKAERVAVCKKTIPVELYRPAEPVLEVFIGDNARVRIPNIAAKVSANG